MKRILFFGLVVVLVIPVSVSADLMVKEYIPGEIVTLDDETGNYWYYNLADFTNMTYDAQIAQISGLGTYGFIDGGWHMATLAEMEALWQYPATDIAAQFEAMERPDTSLSWGGRFDFYYYHPPSAQGYHEVAVVLYDTDIGPEPFKLTMDISDPGGLFITPDSIPPYLGAWVVSDHSVVPVPGALILGATGLLSSTLGLYRLRRKR